MAFYDLNQISIFVAVVEQKGVRAAAEKLGLAQSSVSRAVAALESRLGSRLFERSARAFRVTEEGLLYYQRCSVALSGIVEADRLLRNRREDLCGTLRISAPAVFGKYLMSSIVSAFLESHPKAHLHIEMSDHLVDMVPDGVDFCIRLGSVVLDTNLVSFVLARPIAGLYASAAYLKEHGVPSTPEELKKHITLNLGPAGRKAKWSLKNIEKTAVISLEPILHTNDISTLLNAATQGLGICLVPHFVCKQENLSDLLIQVLPAWEHEAIEVRALYPSRNSVTPLLRAFIDFLVERTPVVLNIGKSSQIIDN